MGEVLRNRHCPAGAHDRVAAGTGFQHPNLAENFRRISDDLVHGNCI